jgi:hypothetical protein
MDNGIDGYHEEKIGAFVAILQVFKYETLANDNLRKKEKLDYR